MSGLTPRGLPLCSLLLAALLSSPPAFAATKAGPVDARAGLQRDRVACMRLREDDARQNCLSEASTRFAASQPSAADEDAAQLLRNALRRCEPLRDAADRQDCVARMQGQGTTSGSVAGGGIYRELVTREVGGVAVPAELLAPAAEVK